MVRRGGVPWMPWSFMLLVAFVSACAAEVQEKSASRFQMPDTDDPQKLQSFIEETMAYEPQSRQDAKDFFAQSPAAVKQAAERILKLDQERKSDSAAFAERVLLQMRIVQVAEQTSTEQEQVYNDLFAFLASKPELERIDIGMGVQLANRLGQVEHPLAGSTFQRLGELLEKNEDPEYARHAAEMYANARRLDLVGNTFQLKGTTLEAAPFNVENWKGKVVLVDFWATWCEPCIAELPRVKQQYAKYHDKGFEVVGVSLDADRMALEKFVKNREIPWTIVHQNDGSGSHPAADYYHINSIPFMALIDRDGKVVSTQARGPELEKLLELQFAP